MRIAVLLDDIHLSETRKDIKHIFIFEIDNKLITAIGEELMKLYDLDYICLWLLTKQVEIIYYDNFNNYEKDKLKRFKIIVKPLDEIRDNPILHALLIKYNI